jgi:AbrB family looped-hinge helix DNA binding protein
MLLLSYMWRFSAATLNNNILKQNLFKINFMRVSTKGQVTIPYEMRTKLGMLPCTEVDFILQDDGILIQKQRGSKRKGSKLLEQLSGKAKLNMSTEYIMKLTRS